MVFDIIFIAILGWAGYRGFQKGIIVQVASLAALILGIIGTIRFSNITTGFLVETFGWKGEYLHIISFIITFIVIVVAVHILARIVERLFQAVALGIVNRLAGVVFSVFKFALIISVVLIIVAAIDANYSFLPHQELNKSKAYKPMLKLAPSLFPNINRQGQNFKMPQTKQVFI